MDGQGLNTVEVRLPRPPELPSTDYDVIVIGGGVNGTGVLRDCSLRGLSACLFERNDLAFGASGNSSGMIHGGVRYLTSSPKVTRLSCLDSGYIQRIAPHLLFRIPFLMPVHRSIGSRVFLQLVDAFFGAYDSFQPLKRGQPHTRLTPDQVRTIEPGLVGDIVGAVTFDEWGIDGARLCTANAVDAHERGAHVRVHTTVEGIDHDPASHRVLGVRWRDRITGITGSSSARVVVNASGAWAPLTATFADLPPTAARVRPGKGIHIVYDRRLSNYAVVAQSIDNRQIFLEPWENVSVLGTTDTDYYGDLDDVVATSDEVRYLVEAISRVFPSVRKARAIHTYAGVRPTLHTYGPIPDKLSREHEIIDHAAHGVAGLYSMIGGKLASYRIFAEQMTDIVAARLGCDKPGSTHLLPLPGGDEPVDPVELARACGIDRVAARRLVYRHGSRAREVGEGIRAAGRTPRFVCTCEAITEQEVRYVIRHEFVRDFADLSRRTRLGLGPCGGLHCALHCGAILADELGWTPSEGRRQALRFLADASRTRAVALGSAQARQEALLLATIRAQVGWGDEL
jgi:glycerol-3-phosphate dehydrogenase